MYCPAWRFHVLLMGLDHSLAWPENLALSFVIAAVVVARRWTKVLVSDTTITWKMQGSTKQVFFIDNVMIHREQESNYKKKVYLRVFEESGISKDYPIHYLSARKYAELFQYIDVGKRENISDEIVREQEFEKLSGQTDRIEWPKEFIKKAERKMSLIMAGIFLGLFTILLFMPLTFLVLSLGAMCVCMVIYSIGYRIRVKINEKRCLASIETSYQWLQIDGQNFNLGNIQRLDITSIQKKSDSIIPVQRYMKIRVENEKYMYWLGSSVSISDEEYQKLITMLEKFFATMPMKLHKKG